MQRVAAHFLARMRQQLFSKYIAVAFASRWCAKVLKEEMHQNKFMSFVHKIRKSWVTPENNVRGYHKHHCPGKASQGSWSSNVLNMERWLCAFRITWWTAISRATKPGDKKVKASRGVCCRTSHSSGEARTSLRWSLSLQMWGKWRWTAKIIKKWKSHCHCLKSRGLPVPPGQKNAHACPR